jgi:hypothetical protein
VAGYTWLKPNLSRRASQDVLLQQTVGSFLVRRSAKDNEDTDASFEIEIKKEGAIHRESVCVTDNGFFRLAAEAGDAPHYATLEELVIATVGEHLAAADF